MSQSRKTFKLIAVLAAALALSLAVLTGCSGSSSSTSSSEDKKITIAACPTPHAQILNEAVAPELEKAGYTLEVKEFTDYVLPNTATEEGDVDANYFQHGPYLDDFNAEKSTHLVSVASVHVEPFGIYSDKISSLSELSDGAVIAVPNDTTNEARALLLLEQEGLIKLDPNAGVTATPNDIVDNPKNLTFRELEAAAIPNALPDVDAAAVNYNYAYDGDIFDKQIAVESSDSLAAQTYANLIVVHEDNKDSEKTKALAAACNADSVRDYIAKNFPHLVVTF